MKYVTIKINLAAEPDKIPSGVDIEKVIKQNIKKLCAADDGILDGVQRSVRTFQVTVLEPEDF